MAKKSSHPKHKHLAILFHRDLGGILCYANNVNHQHAEVRVIEIAKLLGYRHGENMFLLSIAITKAGGFKLAKPCKNCMKACSNYRIGKIQYSTHRQGIMSLGLGRDF